MRRLAVSEHEAFRRLQKTAMDRRVSMAVLADALVKGETSLGGFRQRAPGES
jgi:AmiR/NasT family two-component response regulator